MQSYILWYDNMWQIPSMKAVIIDLPLPLPFHMMWRNITKIIDRLHLANHKDSKCKNPYETDAVVALPPGYNTMVTEHCLGFLASRK